MIKLTVLKQLNGHKDALELPMHVTNIEGIIGVVEFPTSNSSALLLFNNQQVPVKESAATVLALLQEARLNNKQAQASTLGDGGQNNGI